VKPKIDKKWLITRTQTGEYVKCRVECWKEQGRVVTFTEGAMEAVKLIEMLQSQKVAICGSDGLQIEGR